MKYRVLKSTAFKFSLISALLLTGSLLVLGPLSFFYVRHSMIQELRDRIEQEVAVLMQDYRDDGLEELFHDIRERRDINKRNRLLYFFESDTTSTNFDSITRIPKPYGWHEVFIPEYDLKVLLYSMSLSNGNSLAVGGSLDALDRVQRILVRTLVLSIFVTLLMGSFAGLYLSRKFLARVDQVSKAAERIGNGNLEERLKTNGSGDDFDQLVGTINKMLERIELLMKSVRRVSANVAHELRTPLGHLQQDLLRLEESGISTEEGRELINRTKIEIDRVLEIFAALLRISELESGEVKSRFEVLDVSGILRELSESYSPVAEEHGQRIIFHAPETAMRCKGDKRLLLQLFSNLIENAIRHAGDSATIEVSIQGNSQSVEVGIRDDGVGMTPEMLHAAERKLTDLDPGRASDFSRGIGLILVGAIARLHEITLRIQNSNPGFKVEVSMPRVGATMEVARAEIRDYKRRTI